MSTSGPSIDQIKSSMRSAWMAGDFGVVAKNLSGDAEAYVDRIGVSPGERVLDVACGTGNTALPLARRGAVVTGLDIAPNLLAQARERAAAEDLNITFDEGDAEQLPYPDQTFDVVTTMFGAMFAPRPELVASEFARVLKPGGRLAMANWSPSSFSGKLFSVSSRHAPPPQGVAPPVLWGDEATVHRRLSVNFTAIQAEIISILFDLPTNPAGAVDFFRRYFGPTNVAFSRLDPAGQAAFASSLEALWRDNNIAPDPQEHTVIRNEYLQVMATRV